MQAPDRWTQTPILGQAGRFSASFVVPVSLRGGDNGRLRVYVSSRGTPVVEAFGGRAPLAVGGVVQGTPDTEPPRVTRYVADASMR